jgi:hypothetical protein
VERCLGCVQVVAADGATWRAPKLTACEACGGKKNTKTRNGKRPCASDYEYRLGPKRIKYDRKRDLPWIAPINSAPLLDKRGFLFVPRFGPGLAELMPDAVGRGRTERFCADLGGPDRTGGTFGRGRFHEEAPLGVTGGHHHCCGASGPFGGTK